MKERKEKDFGKHKILEVFCKIKNEFSHF